MPFFSGSLCAASNRVSCCMHLSFVYAFVVLSAFVGGFWASLCVFLCLRVCVCVCVCVCLCTVAFFLCVFACVCFALCLVLCAVAFFVRFLGHALVRFCLFFFLCAVAVFVGFHLHFNQQIKRRWHADDIVNAKTSLILQIYEEPLAICTCIAWARLNLHTDGKTTTNCLQMPQA